jgi:ABC-type phosphate transport system substrate-binding protein
MGQALSLFARRHEHAVHRVHHTIACLHVCRLNHGVFNGHKITGFGELHICTQEATGAGASFPAPLYSKWASDYNKATGVKINYQSVGSGAGLRQIEAKTVDFGASDAPLKDEDLNKKGLVQFPTVIGGVVPVVNIKGIAPGQIKLSGQVLGDIYLGKISNWSDPPSRRSTLAWLCQTLRSLRFAALTVPAPASSSPTT